MRIIKKNTANLYRPSSGEYDSDMNWEVVLGDPVPFSCSIQPDLQGHTRVVETSGARSEDFICIFTTTLLQSSDEGEIVTDSQGQPADIVEIDEENYIVFHVLPWRAARRLSHYNALLIKEDAYGKIDSYKSST